MKSSLARAISVGLRRPRHPLGTGCAVRRGVVDAVQPRGQSDRQDRHGAGLQQLEGGSGTLLGLAGASGADGIVVLAGVILIVVRGLLLRPLEMLSQQFVNWRGPARPADRRGRDPLRRDASAGAGSRAAQDQAAALRRRQRQRGLSMRARLLCGLVWSLALAIPGRARRRKLRRQQTLSARCLWARACLSSF